MATTQAPSKFRTLAFLATLVLALVAAVLFSGPLSSNPPAASDTTSPAAPAPTKLARTAPGATDWMERIRNTPATQRDALMREILAIADEDLRNEMATALAATWMEDDLDSYLAFVDELMVGEGLASESMKRFSVALMRSFEEATGKAALKGKIRYVAEAIVTYLISSDIHRAESWAKEHLVLLDLDMALARIAPSMAATDANKAIEIFAGIKSVSPRLTAAPEMGAALAKVNPETAITWARSITTNSERAMAMGGVVNTISASNPAQAAALLKDFLEKIQSEYAALREKDRQQVGAKPADEFETPELYAEYLENNGYALMQPDTPEADYLLKAGERIGFELAKTDPLAAIAWAKSLAVGLVQAHSISGVLSGWSTYAPQEAVAYYVQNHGYDASIPMYLFENWVRQDQAAAVAAIAALPNAAQRSSAIQGVTSGWLESESKLPGLVDWVGQLPAGKDRDQANLAIIDHTTDIDPAAAWQLATRLSDPGTRMRTAREIFTSLAVDNPVAAREILNHYQAPAAELQELARILASAEGGA